MQLGGFKRENNSEWRGPLYAQPETKLNMVRFKGNFRNLNKHIKCKPYSITNIN